MAKQRTLNEIRQSKEYQTALQGGDFIKPTAKPAKSTGEIMNPSKYTENDLEQAKCSIAEKVTKHFNDVIFEMVCEEMGNNFLFQSDNYLTEAGYDMFEDEWFEFYHEHHGDIMHQVMQNITN